jgi:membrane-associated phospholipid phosphatase
MLLATLLPSVLPAQASRAQDSRTVVPRDTANASSRKTLFTSRDAVLAAAFAGLTVAMLPLDEHFAASLQDDGLQANRFLDRVGHGVEWASSPGALMLGGGMFAVGRVAQKPDIADLGWHTAEAVMIATTTTNILKGVMGRSRPYVTGQSNSRDFNFAWGFGGGQYAVGMSNRDYMSFPSGHTATAFAAAAVMTSEARRLWPRTLPYVATATYGGAALVGVSRMYHNRHWASDVVLGAAVGTFSGLKIVRYSHAHRNVIDRMVLGLNIVPTPDGGGAIGVTLPAP